MTQIDQATSDKMIENMAKLMAELHEFRRVHVAKDVTATSPAGIERDSYPDPEKVKMVFSQGWILLEVAQDQAESFIRLTKNPKLPFAASTSVRAILESSALVAWLFDADITAKNRMERNFALRYEGMLENWKFQNSAKKKVSPSDLVKLKRIEDAVSDLAKRIDSTESEAISIGLAKIIDRNGKRNGIGMVMPKVTDIIISVLDEEIVYRMLSGVVHGHFWATSLVGMEINKENLTVQKHFSLDIIAMLCQKTAIVFTKALWRTAHYFAWDVKQLETILENNFGHLQFPDSFRHWKE
jgi:hypothetical protein